MDNLTLKLHPNRTISHCVPYDAINIPMGILGLLFGIPSTTIIIVKHLQKIHQTRSVSAAEAFLLQVNLTNMSLFTSMMLVALHLILKTQLSDTLYMIFYSPSFTARPMFLTALAGIFYLATVHPATYATTKKWPHWEWLVITLVWINALAMVIAVIGKKMSFDHPALMAVFITNFFITMFFTISILRALSSGSQTKIPVKKKLFRLGLSFLAVLPMYYMPRVFVYFYVLIVPEDSERFMCSEGKIILILSMFSDLAMPVIFLYGLPKLEA